MADSTTQSLTAIESAIASGVKRNVISFAPGVYKINDHIDLKSNIELVSNNTCIVSSDTNDYIFRADSIFKNIKISGFTLRYRPVPTVSKNNTSAFYLVEIDTLDIYNNKVLNSPGMGMQLTAIKNARIAFNVIDGVRRDGIHVVNGDNTTGKTTARTFFSENVVIIGNTVKNAGDDKIAVVSYQRPQAVGSEGYEAWDGQQLPNRNITVTGNTVEGGSSAQNSRGISILGGNGISVTGNNVRGHSGGKMIAGIKIDRAPDLDGFPSVNVSVTGNTIIDGQITSLPTAGDSSLAGGIQLGACDSVIIANNIINFSKVAFGIRLRAINTDEAYYRTSARAVQIVNNRINNSRVGIGALSTSTQNNEDITIANNTITNCRRGFISADSVKGLHILDNIMQEVNLDSASGVSAIRANTIERDLIIRGNILRSSSKRITRYAIEATDIDTTTSNALFVEKDNTFSFNQTPVLGYVFFPEKPYRFSSQGNARVHYASTLPTKGTWAVGDITINNDPGNGEIAYWICTTAGSPGTWAQGTAAINGIGINDTTGFELSVTGVATITGVSHVRLETSKCDTCSAHAALDTVTTLNGRTGQIAFISSRNSNRDIVFIDDDNKFDLNQKYVRLQSPKDVLFLLAYSANQWKQVGYFAGNTRQNRFSVEDTVSMVLHAAGTATVAGIGNLILDTFGSAALDTVTTLTGTAGQVIYISTRAGSRDIRFLDSGNFSLAAERLLDTMYDVLVLKATTTTTWKEVSFSNNQ